MRFLARLFVAVFTVWLVACESMPKERASSSWSAIDALGRHEPTLGSLLAPRRDAFVRAAADESEDAASRGRIVSEGWRATKSQRFDQLGARLPDDASGAMDLGPSRFEAMQLRVWLEGARASEARLVDGRVLYENALPAADRVIVSDATTLEELLVLRDESAPRSFTWKMRLPEGLRVAPSQGNGYQFVDASGTPRFALREPIAYDASGKHLALQVAWNDVAQSLSVTLPAGRHAYPLVVDPRYDASVWFNAAFRLPSTRSRHGLAYDSARRQTVLFGGYLGNTLVYDDTWVWDAATLKWTPAAGAGPSARYGHAMVYDVARNQIVLFGGATAAAAELDETWIWTGGSASWAKATPATSPPARYGHTLVYDGARSEVVLFGGALGGTTRNDTWVWNGSTWAQRTPATSPSARFSHAMSFDSTRGEVVVFGGAAGVAGGLGDQPTDDTWVWNGTAWTQRMVATRPSPRSGTGMVFDSDRAETVLFGGGPTTVVNDTWVWNGTAWTQRAPTLKPAARSDHAMVYDTTRHEALVFGGNNQNNTGDLWAWTGSTTVWEQRAPIAPAKRSGLAMAYDARRQEVLLFGGSVNESVTGPDMLSNETWIWRGATSTWSRQSPSASPSPRRAHSLTYDSANDQVVLFGGGDNSGAVYNDTWVYAGSGAARTWTRKTPLQSPSARRGHATAFDSSRSEMILFGGDGLNDTWIWTGTDSTWAQRTPPLSPSVRGGHSLTFDPSKREAVLFGGGAPPSGGTEIMSGELWAWSGSTATWTKRVIGGLTPTPRRGHAMVFDSLRSQLLMFGGGINSNGLGGNAETWALVGTPPKWTLRTPLVSPGASANHGMAYDESRNEAITFGGGYTLALGPSTLAVYNGQTFLHRTLGGACTASSDCLEGSTCLDGVCCGSSACGLCETCGGITPGACSPVTNAEDADSCAVKDGRSCNAAGECRAALGAPAANAAQCASGYVVDGVCCASPSCGPCQTCDIARAESGVTPGTCNVTRAGTDPRNDCADQGAPSCGLNGACDGRGACQQYGLGVACGAVTCVDNRATGKICNGLGTCADSAAGIACGAYACTGDRGCKTTCDTNADCAFLFHCDTGRCIADRGAVCDGDHTVISAIGERQDCLLYRCVGATCPTSCTSRTDCVVTAACDESRHCVPFDAVKPNEDPGGCAASDRAPTPAGSAALAVMLGALGCARARRRRR